MSLRPATRPLPPAAPSGSAPGSPTTHPADRPLRALGFMLLAAGAFALMNTLARGLRAIPWPVLAFARGALGFVVALFVARWRGASLGVRDRRLMWRRSLFGSTGMVCTMPIRLPHHAARGPRFPASGSEAGFDALRRAA